MSKTFLFIFVSLVAQFAAAQSECDLKQLKVPTAQHGVSQQVQNNLAASDPCKVVPGLKAKPLMAIWAMFLSNPQRGGKRLGEDPPLGSPTGKILDSSNGVEFDFSQVATEGLRRFILESNGIPVMTLENPQSLFKVSRQFSRDVEYTWTLATGRASYRGKFTLLDLDTQKEVMSQLTALKQSPLDDLSKFIYEATIYDEAEMYSMRDRVLVEARRRMSN